MTIIKPSRRSFLIGVTSTLFVAPAIVRAEILMPVKKIILPDEIDRILAKISTNAVYGKFAEVPVAYNDYNMRGGFISAHVARVFDEVGKEIMSIIPGTTFEQTRPSRDLVASLISSGLAVREEKRDAISGEMKISLHNGWTD